MYFLYILRIYLFTFSEFFYGIFKSIIIDKDFRFFLSKLIAKYSLFI